MAIGYSAAHNMLLTLFGMSFEKKKNIGETLKASASQNKTIFVNFTKTMESCFF